MPVTVERFIEELEKLKADMVGGKLQHSEYDQRLARMIQELRDAGLSADRNRITAAVDNALSRGVITPAVKAHIEKRLGLA